MEKKLYMVETISTFKLRYVVNALTQEDAMIEFVKNLGSADFKEFSQRHVGEELFGAYEISGMDFIREFDADNDYCKSWDLAQKMKTINESE